MWPVQQLEHADLCGQCSTWPPSQSCLGSRGAMAVQAADLPCLASLCASSIVARAVDAGVAALKARVKESYSVLYTL